MMQKNGQKRSWTASLILLALVFTFLPLSSKAATSLDELDLTIVFPHPSELVFEPLQFTPVEAERIELENGIVLYLLEDHELPIVEARAFIRAGADYDPFDKVGLASLTVHVMRTGGTQRMSGDELDERLEFLAASASASGFSTLSQHLEEVLAVFADILVHPTFENEKLELARQRTLEAIRRENDQPTQIAFREFIKRVAEGHPSGWFPSKETIQNITREDLIRFHERFYHPNNLILAVAGDFQREELIEKNILEIVPNLKETGRYDKYLDVIKSGKPFSSEDVIYNRQDGSLSSHLSVRAFKVGDDLGLIFTNITERKKAEAQIKQIKERLERLTDNADEAIFSVGARGRYITYANPTAERLFGYSKAEWISDPHLGAKIILPDFVERQKEIIEEIYKNKKPIKNAVLGWKAKDGHEVIMEYTIIPIIDKNGQVVYFESIGRDITDRKKKEDKLLLHSEIMTNMSEGVYLIRLEDLIIVYANPRFEEMFGYEHGELIGKYVVIVNATTDKTPEETKDEIVGILKETGEWHGEVKNIKKDGTPFWCYANVSLFNHPEYGTVIVSVHTDITKRKEAVEAL
ncbi:hypothetical protein LCGC14_2023080, partial [marine sediment metagenome]